MATGVATGFFSEMLDDRLRNFNKRLSADAFELLNQMELDQQQRREKPLEEREDEDAREAQKVRSLDVLIPELRRSVAPETEMIKAADIRRILDFFCPGLPPIC